MTRSDLGVLEQVVANTREIGQHMLVLLWVVAITAMEEPLHPLVACCHQYACPLMTSEYTMLKEYTRFEVASAEAYDQQYRERELKYLQRKAAKLGFDLAPKALTEPVPG